MSEIIDYNHDSPIAGLICFEGYKKLDEPTLGSDCLLILSSHCAMIILVSTAFKGVTAIVHCPG